MKKKRAISFPSLLSSASLRGFKSFGPKPVVHCVEILNYEGDMPVAVAKIVRFGAIFVDRELDFVRRLGIRKIDKCEVGEVQAIGDVESERFFVESKRSRLVQHANHRVDRLRHVSPGASRRLRVATPRNTSEATGARVLSAYYAD